MEKGNKYNGQVYVPVSQLRIPEYNSKKELPRKMETIRKGIQSFGVKSPLIVNENPSRENVIVHGVSVFKIAKELGIEEVPVMYVDLDIEEEKKLRVLLDQKGTLEPSPDEIIDLIGQLEYEDFFSSSVPSDTLSKLFEAAEKKTTANPPKEKKDIEQLLIRLPLEVKELFRSV